MSRLRQFAKGVGFSWLATLATVTYSLLSVPIALRYLSVEEFGLFVLVIQIAAYFALFELGMSAATARFLVDYKDDPNEGSYGSVVQTGSWVFATQALIVLIAGLLIAPSLVRIVGVPEGFAEVAVFLVRCLAFTSALTMSFRIYSAILYANKRLDLIHAINGANMLLGLALLVAILGAGGGLAGLAWLFFIQAIFGIALMVWCCHRLRLLPEKGNWGSPSKTRFRELFAFGKDVFIVNISNQILEASQLLIITRTMGLTSAAVWSVSTKLFMLVYQLVTKIEGTAIVFFAEMMVRGEVSRLAARFRQVYQITAGLSVVALVVVVSTNKAFVSLWAEPSLAWSNSLNCLMAVFVFLNAVTRCSGDLIIHTKKIAGFRYVYLGEAVFFVVLGLWLSSELGFHGLLAACIICLLLFRGAYTTFRISHYFSQPMSWLYWDWLKRPIFAVLVLMPFVVFADMVAGKSAGVWYQLWIAGLLVGVPCLVVLFAIALPRDIASETIARFRNILSSGAST